MSLTKEWIPLKMGIIEEIEAILNVSKDYFPLFTEQQKRDYKELETCSQLLRGEITRLPIKPQRKVKLKKSGVT